MNGTLLLDDMKQRIVGYYNVSPILKSKYPDMIESGSHYHDLSKDFAFGQLKKLVVFDVVRAYKDTKTMVDYWSKFVALGGQLVFQYYTIDLVKHMPYKDMEQILYRQGVCKLINAESIISAVPSNFTLISNIYPGNGVNCLIFERSNNE